MRSKGVFCRNSEMEEFIFPEKQVFYSLLEVEQNEIYDWNGVATGVVQRGESWNGKEGLSEKITFTVINI